MPSIAVGAASSSANPIKAVLPQALGVPSTVVGAASLSANPAHPPPQKAKALPGPKTNENDAHISLRLSIAEQLCCSGVYLITNAPLRKQGKVNTMASTEVGGRRRRQWCCVRAGGLLETISLGVRGAVCA